MQRFLLDSLPPALIGATLAMTAIGVVGALSPEQTASAGPSMAIPATVLSGQQLPR